MEPVLGVFLFLGVLFWVPELEASGSLDLAAAKAASDLTLMMENFGGLGLVFLGILNIMEKEMSESILTMVTRSVDLSTSAYAPCFMFI